MITDTAAHVLRIVRERDYYPHIDEIDGFGSLAEVNVRDERKVNFSSNDYLGLSRHPRVIEAARVALEKYGLGSGGSRLTSGNHNPHVALERRIASFKGAEDAVVFSAGYLANAGLINALTGGSLRNLVHTLAPDQEIYKSVEIYFDELDHSSILDGISNATHRFFSGGKVTARPYNHLDVDHLEDFLENSKAENRLIITDGVFSLHGRIAPLDKIVEVAKKHNAEVYVDDAHGTGVFGAKGHGTAEHLGVGDKIDFQMGTLSKALGGSGGYMTGTKDLCDYLRVASRTYMFQTSMAPSMAAGLVQAFNIIDEEPERRQGLLKNAEYVRKELIGMGFDIFGSKTQIIPIRFGSDHAAKKAMEVMFEDGIFAPCYYYPAVKPGEAMIRVNLMSTHEPQHLERLLEAARKAGKETHVLNGQ